MSRRAIIGCVLASGGKTIDLTNLVPNGDMSGGTTNWQHYSNYSTESIVSGALKSLRNTTKPYVGTVSSWGILPGHKVYVKSLLYGNKAGTVRLLLEVAIGLSLAGETSVYVTTTPTVFSAVITTATNYGNVFTFDGQSFNSSGNYIMIDNVVVIDLTSSFGAGNEPTAAQMDELMTQFADGWFSGTKSATYSW